MGNQTYRKSHVFVELAHPLGVTACKVVVDGYDVYAFACEGVEVRRKGSNQGFTFTGFHLGNTSLVQDDSADYLYGEVLHSKHTPARLAACGKCVGKNIIESLAVCKSFFEKNGLVFKLALAHLSILVLEREHLVANRLNALNLALAVVAEHCF